MKTRVKFERVRDDPCSLQYSSLTQSAYDKESTYVSPENKSPINLHTGDDRNRLAQSNKSLFIGENKSLYLENPILRTAIAPGEICGKIRFIEKKERREKGKMKYEQGPESDFQTFSLSLLEPNETSVSWLLDESCSIHLIFESLLPKAPLAP